MRNFPQEKSEVHIKGNYAKFNKLEEKQPYSGPMKLPMYIQFFLNFNVLINCVYYNKTGVCLNVQ